MQKLEDIDYAIPAKAHTSMYLMHKFWARKPHNVVREYIEHYSKPNEIVLDPFCGSGVTAIEALKAGRKAIAIDLDPIATFITKMSVTPVDLKKFEDAFDKIEEKTKNKIERMYQTKCNKCGKIAEVICTHWKNTTPIKIMFECSHCGKKGGKSPAQEDIDAINKINSLSIPHWYPTTKLWYDNVAPFMKKEKRNYVHELFTKRNLIALSILYNEIENLEEGIIKNLMKFTFTSMVHLGSILTPVRPTRQYSSFWPVHSYWVPPIFMESNVWMLFDSAFKGRQGTLKGKTESNTKIKNYKEAKNFDEFKSKNANIMIKTHNALELDEIITPNSIDYVFTDPPYGGSIQYMELSTLWASWLRGREGNKEFDLNFADEITINEGQKKDFEYYHKMLCAAFEQIYKVLKSGRWVTVTFHNTDVKTYTSILEAGMLAGFDPEKIIYQPPARMSAKGLLQPYGSAVGDYYIRFRKPETREEWIIGEVDVERYEKVVVETAKKMIAERGEPTPLTHLLTMYPELKKKGVLLGAKLRIDDVLKKYEGKEFILVDVKDEKGKVIGKKWWLKEPEKYLLHYVPLNERIERTVIDVLTRKVKISFDDILQTLYIKFQNALTPAQDIMRFLKIYAKPTPDGKWRLLPEVERREREHDEIVKMLAELGGKASFRVYADIPEWLERERKLPTKFPLVPEENQRRVKEIDCIWFTDKRIEYEFEVENTTGIEGAIIRGANIPDSDSGVNRFIVIPEERENLLLRVVNEPALRERVEKDNWRFIFYDALKSFYNENKDRRKMDISEFEKLARIPKLKIKKIEKQQTLSDYD